MIMMMTTRTQYRHTHTPKRTHTHTPPSRQNFLFCGNKFHTIHLCGSFVAIPVRSCSVSRPAGLRTCCFKFLRTQWAFLHICFGWVHILRVFRATTADIYHKYIYDPNSTALQHANNARRGSMRRALCTRNST